jgi:hypothetical protein
MSIGTSTKLANLTPESQGSSAASDDIQLPIDRRRHAWVHHHAHGQGQERVIQGG